MSYYRIYHPTKEQMEQIESRAKRSSYFGYNSKDIELRTYCLLEHPQDKINEAISHIWMLLNSIKYDTEALSYSYAVSNYKDSDDETITFMGRNHDGSSYNDREIEETIKYVIEKLITLTFVVKTPDWFDEGEKFCEKATEINETIEYFKDSVALAADYEIMDFLKDCEDPEDDHLYWQNKSVKDVFGNEENESDDTDEDNGDIDGDVEEKAETENE